MMRGEFPHLPATSLRQGCNRRIRKQSEAHWTTQDSITKYATHLGCKTAATVQKVCRCMYS